MYTEKEVSLVKFFQSCLSNARESGFLYVCCLVARTADYPLGLNHLKEHWSSYHDLSGKDVLVILAGYPTITSSESGKLLAKIHERDPEFRFFRRFQTVRVVNKNASLLPSETHMAPIYDSMIGHSSTADTFSPDSHSMQISELINYFGVGRSLIPFLSIASTFTSRKFIIPLNCEKEDDLYSLLKDLKDKIHPYRSEILDQASNIEKKMQVINDIKENLSDFEMVGSRNILNQRLLDWVNVRMHNKRSFELDEFVSAFVNLKRGEHPNLNREDSLSQLRSLTRSPKRYQSGKKIISRYYDLVEHEKQFDLCAIDERYDLLENCENEMIEKVADLVRNEEDMIQKISNNRKISEASNIIDAFDTKINLGITKIDVKKIFSALKQVFR